jgi:hypothetical protein
MPFTASTWNAATSMAAAVPNISTDNTSREIFFFRTKIPSIPAKGPHLTLTQVPHLRKGCVSIRAPLSTARRIASISKFGIAAG